MQNTSEREEFARQENERHAQVKRSLNKARILIPIRDGCALVVSDEHHYPGLPPSVAHRASAYLAKRMRPFCIISNGDAIDGASISRWPAGSFTALGERPLVAAEIAVTVERFRDFEKLTHNPLLIHNLGNHDARFETYLAEHVPEYAGVNGFRLKDHFPLWMPAWRTDFMSSEDAPYPEVIVKHRFKPGQYAAQNDALWAGTSTVTGHDHTLWCKPITDARGLRWGCKAGTVAPLDSPLFVHYTEDNVKNWQQGCLLLHFQSGRFIGPEPVHVIADGQISFRGNVIEV